MTSGIITFDDQDTYAAALIINSNNLSDTTSYLTNNITTAYQTVAFAYDKNSDGSADSTFVYNAGTGTKDSLVLLINVLGTSLSMITNTTNTAIDGLIPFY